jgi:hypothetical protein
VVSGRLDFEGVGTIMYSKVAEESFFSATFLFPTNHFFSSGFNSNAAEFMQYRRPVGFGPSGKT